MSRFLGIDYGDSRIGLALSDPMKIIGKPFKTLDNKKNDILNELRLIVQKNEVIRFVVGYPINMKGENTPQTKKVDDFIIFLEKSGKINLSSISNKRYSSISF